MSLLDSATLQKSEPDYSSIIGPSDDHSLSDSVSWANLVPVIAELAKLAQPPVERTPAKWADASRVLPEGSPEPGQFRSSRTPYCIAIGNMCADHRFRRVAVIMGTQMGKTAGLLNVAGRKLDDDPAPVIYLGPTKSNIDKVIEPQVMNMLRECASLSAKMERRGKPSKHVKKISGVSLRLAWAGSATEVASQPAHTVLADEVDKMRPVPGVGDPLTEAEARTSNYPDGKFIATSSPSEGTVDTARHPETGIDHFVVADAEEVGSTIWKMWQEGTRHEFAVPCPHCGEFFPPRFKLLTWPEKATPARALREAKLACPHCAALIGNEHKESMNSRGTFLAPGQKIVGFDMTKKGEPRNGFLLVDGSNGEVVGEPPETDTVSFWVSGLLSPWVTFGQRAAAWLKAVATGDQNKIRTVINTAFGELYRTRGQAPAWDVIRDGCKADYKLDVVARGVRGLFLTVDVQGNRLVCVVRGWGVAYESWLVHREELWGETDQPAVWERLDALSESTFGGMPIVARAVDSGYRTDQVYAWIEKHGAHSYATKGRDNPSKLYNASDVEVTRDGKKVKSGLKVWTLDDKYFKGWVHDRFGWPQDQPGAWHLPDDIDEDYCKQLIAEQRMRLPSGRTRWLSVSKDNHYLDCEAMQVFLAHVEGVRDLKQLDDDTPAAAPAVRKPRVVRSNYLRNR